jgi:hypothetical protein
MMMLLDKYDQVQKALEHLESLEKKMREGKPLELEARINVTEKAHAGTVFRTGDAMLELKDPVQGPASFKPTDDRKAWSTVPYQDLTKE